MASYMLRGLDREDVMAFRQRCRDAGVEPAQILATFIKHAEPKYLQETGDTRIACAITVHHAVAS